MMGFCEPYIVLWGNHHNIPLWMGCIVMHVRQIRSCRKENLLIFLPPKSEWPPGEARVCWNLEDNFCSQSDHRFVQIIQETWQKLPKNYEKILNIRIRCSTSLFTIYRQYYSFCRLSSMAHAEGCNFLAEPKDSTWSCNVGAMRGAQLVAAKSSWNRCWGHFISTNVEIKTTFQMGQPKTKSGFLFIDKFNPSTSSWNTGFQWFGSDCIPFVQESRLLQIQISRLHIINQVNWGSFSPKTIQLPNSAGGYNIVSYDVLGKAYNAYTNGMIQQGMDRVSECCWFWVSRFGCRNPSDAKSDQRTVTPGSWVNHKMCWLNNTQASCHYEKQLWRQTIYRSHVHDMQNVPVRNCLNPNAVQKTRCFQRTLLSPRNWWCQNWWQTSHVRRRLIVRHREFTIRHTKMWNLKSNSNLLFPTDLVCNPQKFATQPFARWGYCQFELNFIW